MSGFLPIPHAALAAVAEDEWIAVMDLYRRAHMLRWEPLRVTERSLVTKWRLGNRRVWGVLEALRDAGLLEFERGDNRRPTTVRVYSPTDERQEVADMQQRGLHSGQRTVQRSEPESTEDISDRAAQPTAQDAAQDAENLSETRERDLKENVRPAAGGPPPGWEEAVEVYQTVYRPAIGKRVHPPLKPGQGNGKHLSTLLKRHGLEDTTRLLRHCATSPKRSFLRERGYDLQTVVRHSQEYLDDALQETPALRLASPSRPPDPGPRPPPPEELATLEELDALMAVVAGGRRAS